MLWIGWMGDAHRLPSKKNLGWRSVRGHSPPKIRRPRRPIRCGQSRRPQVESISNLESGPSWLQARCKPPQRYRGAAEAFRIEWIFHAMWIWSAEKAWSVGGAYFLEWNSGGAKMKVEATNREATAKSESGKAKSEKLRLSAKSGSPGWPLHGCEIACPGPVPAPQLAVDPSALLGQWATFCFAFTTGCCSLHRYRALKMSISQTRGSIIHGNDGRLRRGRARRSIDKEERERERERARRDRVRAMRNLVRARPLLRSARNPVSHGPRLQQQ